MPVGCHAHQPGVLPVLHVADELAVFDQHVVAGGRALVVDGDRAAAAVDRAVIDDGDAGGGDHLAEQAGKGRGLLAVEIAFQPVADGFVQHDARPAGAENDVHRAGRRVDRFEIDERLAQRLVGAVLPVALGDEIAEADAPAAAVGAALLPVAFADDDGDVDARHRPDVAHAVAVGAQDIDDLPARGDRGRHLAHLVVLAAQIGVDLLQDLHLLLEARLADRVFVAVEFLVGALRRCRIGAGIAARDRADGIGRALQRRNRKIARMRVADRFAGNGAQAETLVGVEAAALQAAIVERSAIPPARAR